ncbi:MAG: ABC transporter ATP-binding protein [Proteobacteria bacterium]|nr:ABC transporter ATP-binding protein [Pseudomonadota bacterium]
MTLQSKIIQTRDLNTSFFCNIGEIKAVRGVSFHLNEKEVVGIVGESGSGKSVTSLSILKLLQHPGKIKNGDIFFKNERLNDKSNKEMRRIRGNRIAMIFQDPMTSLNPVFTVENQIVEVIKKHQKISGKQAREKALGLLKLVGIPSPEKRMKSYPHECSGGMRQRIMIAIALSCEPDVLIADEPTTALDVTIQAQILDLLKELKDKMNTSIILITHDLGVVANLCSRIIVMYGGMIMESGTVKEIYSDPRHPYTVGLMKAIPRISFDEKKKLTPILGSPPDLLNPPKGCPFSPRCEWAMRICMEKTPPFKTLNKDRGAMCWLLHKDAPKVDFGLK